MIIMNQNTFILFFSALAGILFFMTSCEESVILDPKEKVVNVKCILSNDTVQTVKLTYSSYISDNYYPPVKNAEVSVSYDTIVPSPVEEHSTIDSTIIIKFKKIEDGIWQSKFIPVPKREYNLLVTVPEYDSITASTSYPSLLLASPYLFGSVNRPMIRHFDYVVGTTPCILWVYGMDYNPVTKKHNLVDLIYTDNYYLDKFNVTTTFKGDVPEFQMPDVLNQDPDPLHFPGVVPQYYALEDGLFDSKDVPMYKHYLRIVYPDVPLDNMIVSPYDEFREILKPQFKDDIEYAFNVMASFKPQYYDKPHPKSYMMFLSVSDEYDHFLKDVLKFDMGRFFDIEGSDIAHLWEYKEVYSNIKNGRGVFGAEYHMSFRISNDWMDDYYGK